MTSLFPITKRRCEWFKDISSFYGQACLGTYLNNGIYRILIKFILNTRRTAALWNTCVLRWLCAKASVSVRVWTMPRRKVIRTGPKKLGTAGGPRWTLQTWEMDLYITTSTHQDLRRPIRHDLSLRGAPLTGQSSTSCALSGEPNPPARQVFGWGDECPSDA